MAKLLKIFSSLELIKKIFETVVPWSCFTHRLVFDFGEFNSIFIARTVGVQITLSYNVQKNDPVGHYYICYCCKRKLMINVMNWDSFVSKSHATCVKWVVSEEMHLKHLLKVAWVITTPFPSPPLLWTQNQIVNWNGLMPLFLSYSSETHWKLLSNKQKEFHNIHDRHHAQRNSDWCDNFNPNIIII